MFYAQLVAADLLGQLKAKSVAAEESATGPSAPPQVASAATPGHALAPVDEAVSDEDKMVFDVASLETLEEEVDDALVDELDSDPDA